MTTDEIRRKWEANFWDDRHLICHQAIGALLEENKARGLALDLALARLAEARAALEGR